MTDVLTKTQRSFNMSRIKAENTGPEIKFRNFLHSHGIRNFKMYPKKILGKPDFYFPGEKLTVFIDGCFWHGCKKCFQKPQTNKKFWMEKVKNNMKRDLKVNSLLSKEGFKVVRFWEHEIEKLEGKRFMRFIDKLKNKIIKAPKVLDLFAGAGGLSEGFIRAGCEIIGHIEMDKNACNTLITRMVYHALLKKGKLDDYKNYVLGKITIDALIEKYRLQKERDSVICAEIGKHNYKKLIGQIKERLNGGNLDMIVGGPPCQAYSYIGRARDNKNMRRDERNFLYRYYVEFLKVFKPKIFVFENVPGLESAGKGRYLKDMRHLMKQVGYNTDYKILNAADFGVPQNRKRIILIGWSRVSKLKGYPDFPEVERKYSVSDFFTGLPKVCAGENRQTRKFLRRNELLEKLGILNPQFGLLMDHIARSNTRQDLEIYRLAVLAKQKGKNIKYNHLPERLKTHNNEEGFLDRFKVVDTNERGSHTVVAHIAKDGHFYIHPDIKQNRSLTIREAARLQTFPDDYKLEGGRGSRFKQIGNAVPPMFSEIIAHILVNYL
ncbi:DNA mismatch endonuclease Vsr [bacterium]|nr:MAG: DNA mismatch endonuclease Vsr [bacterium]